ncbi:molybdopterin molybdotransferase MoeA [Sneathiella chinensis]|uniref:Molybdopterin molybdenumtransferase n=1 Tax=Sneathiella chinensis TaxID=349750 RepID=A0ABQ5U4Y2_9PROT|nr:gephyrin-like molybdotransferase Glp [Sneathiella chinensis]GLQ07215.1 molybdopterin molybdenumtransferase MoeA [Sneathiella chinensis]
MISVEEARKNILSALSPLTSETVSISEACGRYLSENITPRRTQPPADLSAMDGYAVRAADVQTVPVTLNVVGEAPAGGSYDSPLGAGQAVRIFTGGPLPEGADAIVIQEDTTREGDRVTVLEGVASGRYVRKKGLDFTEGQTGLAAGRKLTPRDIGLLAAMNVPWVSVYRKPRIALLATGDELVRPGEPVGPNQIISSNTLLVAAMIEQAGGIAIDLGIAKDNEQSLRQMAAGARSADMLVTLGGASVGDHDLVQSILGKEGLQIDFWRIAMRPGKPLMFGDLNGIPMLGMPGNPVSSMMCSYLFLLPAMLAMLGQPPRLPKTTPAILGNPLNENDRREDYLRARITGQKTGIPVIETVPNQDSSLLSALSGADCLLKRPPFAPALSEGAAVEVILLDTDFPPC